MEKYKKRTKAREGPSDNVLRPDSKVFIQFPYVFRPSFFIPFIFLAQDVKIKPVGLMNIIALNTGNADPRDGNESPLVTYMFVTTSFQRKIP